MKTKVTFSIIAVFLFTGGIAFIRKEKTYTKNQNQIAEYQQTDIRNISSESKLILDDWFTLSMPESEVIPDKSFSIQRMKDVKSILFFKKYEGKKLLHDEYTTYDYIGSIGFSSVEQGTDFNPIFNTYRGQIPSGTSLLDWIQTKQKENISPDFPLGVLKRVQESVRILKSENEAEVAYFHMPEPSDNGWYAFRDKSLLYLFNIGNNSDAVHGMKNNAWDALFISTTQNTSIQTLNDVFRGSLGAAQKKEIFSIPSKEKLPSFCPECEENGVDTINGQNWEFAVSSDQKQYAYMASTNGKQIAVLNGKPLQPYTFVHHLRFSPDNKIFSYHAYDEARGETYLIVNEREVPVYPEDEGYPHAANGVSEAFSNDGQIAYARVRKENFDEMEIYLNDRLINKIHGGLIHFWFDEDGKHLNYVALTGSQKGSLYEDDKLIDDSVDYNAYTSSQYAQYLNGIRMKERNTKIQVVDKGIYVGGKELSNYTGRNPEVYINNLLLSPGQDELAYLVWVNGRIGLDRISLNGHDSAESFSDIKDIQFSEDGKSLNYVGRIGRSIYFVSHEILGK